jgi:hypothetical protein
MARRTNRRTKPRDRRARDTTKAVSRPNVKILSVTDDNGSVIFTLDGPFLYVGGLPGITMEGAVVTQVSNVTSSTFTLTFFDAGSDSYVIKIPQDDPSIRTRGGGYLAAGCITLFI